MQVEDPLASPAYSMCLTLISPPVQSSLPLPFFSPTKHPNFIMQVDNYQLISLSNITFIIFIFIIYITPSSLLLLSIQSQLSIQARENKTKLRSSKNAFISSPPQNSQHQLHGHHNHNRQLPQKTTIPYHNMDNPSLQ